MGEFIDGEWKCPERCDDSQLLQGYNKETGKFECPERCDDSQLFQEYNEETGQFECPRFIYPPLGRERDTSP